MELIIAIVLISTVVLGLTSINIFSHFHLLNSERRAKLQHEVGIALEYMAKAISMAIGNEILNGANSVIKAQVIGSDYAIWAYIDAGDPLGQRDTVNDHWIVYRFTAASGAQDDRYQIWYCPQCTNGPCTQCNPAWGSERIARNISSLTLSKHTNASGQLDNNSVGVQISACWDPAASESVDNPCVTMSASIQMPSVSTR